MQTTTIQLSPDRRRDWDGFLSGEIDSQVGNAERIDSAYSKFDEDLEVTAYLTEASPSPYIDLILFEKGKEDVIMFHEAGAAEPIYDLPAERVFETEEDQYKVTIE